MFQRADALDVSLTATKLIQLDRNKCLDLELRSGWNDIQSCKIRVRAATGGLRLLVHEAQIVKSKKKKGKHWKACPIEFARPPDGAVFFFGRIGRDSSVIIRFPFTIEQEVMHVSAKVEVFFTTTESGGGEGASFTFAKTPTVPVALALDVNVQDVFKHQALFSRFIVSTASHSPMRLYRSKLIESDFFEAAFGLPPAAPVMIFAKQPACLLYRITRKQSSLSSSSSSPSSSSSKYGGASASAAVKPTSRKAQKTMYLRLLYSVLLEEIDAAVEKSLTEELEKTATTNHLRQFVRPLIATVLSHLHANLSSHDLDRAALMGYFSTAFLAEVRWTRFFAGIGNVTDGEGESRDAATKIAEFLLGWQKRHPKFHIPVPKVRSDDGSDSDEGKGSESYDEEDAIREILIAVDIPSVTIVHTADIKIHQQQQHFSPFSPYFSALSPTNGPTNPSKSSSPCDSHSSTTMTIVTTNQLLSATLHLRWTRAWDTTGREPQDLEFSYEITAPGDTWLIGGRKKGHFVIPGHHHHHDATTSDKINDTITPVPPLPLLESTPDTEASIPLLLSPLREGWLPYPQVDIREVKIEGNEYDGGGIGGSSPMADADGAGAGAGALAHGGHGHCETDFRNLGETVRVVADRESVTMSLDSSGPEGGPLVLESQAREAEGRIVL